MVAFDSEIIRMIHCRVILKIILIPRDSDNDSDGERYAVLQRVMGD